MYLIQSLGLATGEPMYMGEFLSFWDPDGNNGRGLFVWTPDPNRAQRFTSQSEALKEYRLTSPSRPIRPDGAPNRPMTAFTVAVVPLLEVLNGL